MHGTGTEHIDPFAQTPLQAVLCDAPARLDQELPLPLPFLLELLGRTVQFLPDQIVQHNNVRACSDGLVGLLKRLALDVDEQGVARDAADRLDGFGDGS
jgi:hypothetical protein